MAIRLVIRLWSMVLVATIAGCASVGKTSPVSKYDPARAGDYYPMNQGSVWSYDVDTGTGLSTLAVTRVVSVDDSVVRIQTSQSPPIAYELRSEGIYNRRDGVWILKEPLSVGNRWPARGGRLATIVDVDKRMSTNAGEFQPCVDVHEEGGDAELQIDTTYCLGVGPVEIVSKMRSKLTSEVSAAKALLRGFSL